ncbi:hypothetical protein Mal4_50410 [Maioricimonas rarisocia]|uniref:DUF58 domain-containing protein n=1 Tax=Maioricimonas rarisocia TaxID=2528026 RepID=A0A517ZDY0_9PLAN|nr:DUF58 domain-containing protein [Maioricimonas rarisocia]QDU40683.1 hypothetical protein Mal4_50410 [Maioricimonas rarisocia]
MTVRSLSLMRTLRHWWGFKLTPLGRYLVLSTLLAGLGTVTVEIPIYMICCLLLAMIGTAEMIGLCLRTRVDVSGQLPEKMNAGDSITTMLQVRNRSRRPAYDIMAALPGLPADVTHEDADVYVPHIPGRGAATLPVTLRATQRGFLRIPELRVHSTFPFNLMRVQYGQLSPHSVTVLPTYHLLDHLDLPVTHRYQPGGLSVSAGTGHSPEYIGNREYVPGEPASRLDFRAWARLGKPIVREYMEEYFCRIAVILDTFVPRRRARNPQGFPDLEAAVSLTAAVSDSLRQGDYVIDVFAAGPELYVFRTSGGTTHFDAVLEILACLEPCRSDPFDEVGPVVSEELEAMSTAICIFLDWDEPRRRLCETIREAGCSLKVIIVRDGPTTLAGNADTAEVQQISPEDIRAGRIRQL